MCEVVQCNVLQPGIGRAFDVAVVDGALVIMRGRG